MFDGVSLANFPPDRYFMQIVEFYLSNRRWQQVINMNINAIKRKHLFAVGLERKEVDNQDSSRQFVATIW